MLNYITKDSESQQQVSEELEKEVENMVESAYQGRKEETQHLAGSYFRLSADKQLNIQLRQRFRTKMQRTEECGTWLKFKIDKVNNKVRLARANFCKDRLCPMCNWRRSLKLYSQLSKIIDYLEENNYVVNHEQRKVEYIFMTLTVRNCSRDELQSTIQELLQAFDKLRRKTKFKNAFKGWFRSLEITRNKKLIEHGLEFHPHLHLLVAVDAKEYFKSRNNIYITSYDLRQMWADCLKISNDSDYRKNLQVDMRKVKLLNNKTSSEEIAKQHALRELSKYVAKSTDYINLANIMDMDETILNLTSSLYGKKLIGFSGIFSKIRKQLKLTDVERGKLEDDEEIRLDIASCFIAYRFKNGKYIKI